MKLYIKENAIVDDTNDHDDYTYYLEKKLNRIKSVDKLRKTLEELGFTQTGGIDYNTWDNYYGDDASFDTWEKTTLLYNLGMMKSIVLLKQEFGNFLTD